VCGCPLVVNVFELSGEFCRVPKRRCNRHHAWEKLRRAEVDMERLRQVTICPLDLSPTGPLQSRWLSGVVVRASDF